MTHIPTPLKMYLGAFAGSLSALGLIVISSSAFFSGLGGRSSYSLLFFGIVLAVSGPVLIGKTNTNLMKSLSVSIVGLVITWLSIGVLFSILFLVFRQFQLPLFIDPSIIIAILSSAVLVTVVDTFTRDNYQSQIIRGVLSCLLAIFVGILLAIGSSIILTIVRPTVIELGQAKTLVDGLIFTGSTGFNVIFFIDKQVSTTLYSSRVGQFFGFNLLAFTFLIANGLLITQ